jgi:hypothetical protein
MPQSPTTAAGEVDLGDGHGGQDPLPDHCKHVPHRLYLLGRRLA